MDDASDASLLAALQLADSFFPSGMITLSHGLEGFLCLQPQSGKDLPRLLEDYLWHKVAPLELVAYLHAYRAAETADLEHLQYIDRYLTASLLPQELRQGSARSGRAVLETLSPLENVTNNALFQAFVAGVRTQQSEGNAAICLALVCLSWQVPQRAGGIILLYTFMVSFLGAALRLGSIGHREVQRILLSLRPQLSSLLDTVWERDLEELGGFAPLADIRAMQHAYLPVRLFSS